MGRKLILALICAVFMATAAASAAAYVPPAPQRPTAISASYRGWGYGFSTANSIVAWRWSSAGWIRSTLPAGAGLSIYPFGSGYSWAYRSGYWYAVYTSSVTEWTCGSATGGNGWFMPLSTVYQYPTRSSKVLMAEPVKLAKNCEADYVSATEENFSQCGGVPGSGCWPVLERYAYVRASNGTAFVNGYVKLEAPLLP